MSPSASASVSDQQRGTLLRAVAGLATTSAADSSAKSKLPAAGKPGDFDFLSGNWKIKNRQFKNDA